MERQTFGICFLLRKCKADKQRADIYVRITVDGEEAEFSSKEKININQWNAQKSIVKGNGIEAKSINEHLDNIRISIKDKYRRLTDREELVTAQSIKDAYLAASSIKKGHRLKELLTYYKKIWQPKLKPGGYKNYKTTLDYIERFVDESFPAKDIYLSQVDTKFVTDLEYYIRMNPAKIHDPCNGNGLGKHIQRFKRIITWATNDLKWLKEDPCSSYKCPLKKSKRKKLDMRELVLLESRVFLDPDLHYVQQLFLNSCYTGLAFIDSMELAETDFEWEENGTVWCNRYRTKSDELCSVLLLESAAKILQHYRLQARQEGRRTIFSKITNQQVNRSLKIIQEVCGINTPLTFHVARHTFAKTVALKNGIPLETVQMMMGHAKITTTQIYADVDEEKIKDDMRGLEEKLNRKRLQLQNNPTVLKTM